MAKSIKSKVKRKFRAARRVLLDAQQLAPQSLALHERLKRIAAGAPVRGAERPKNAFLHGDKGVFPQLQRREKIDFRLPVENVPR